MKIGFDWRWSVTGRLKHRDSFGKEKKKKKNLFYIW